MIRKISALTIVLLCIFFLTCHTIEGKSLKIRNISRSPLMSEMPAVGLLSDGDLLLVWSEGSHYASDSNLYFRVRSDENGKWTPARKVFDVDLKAASFPHLVVDERGDAHMVFTASRVPGVRFTAYARFSAGVWSGWKTVTQRGQGDQFWPRIQVDQGTVAIMFSHQPDTGKNASIQVAVHHPNDPWPVPPGQRKTVAFVADRYAIHPHFILNGEHMLAAWMADYSRTGEWDLYMSERLAGFWQPALRLVPGEKKYFPYLVRNGSGGIALLYSHNQNPVYLMTKTSWTAALGEGWSEPQPLVAAGTESAWFNTAVFSGERLHTLTRQSCRNGERILYFRLKSDGTRERQVRIFTGIDPQYPGLAVDARGRVHMVWSDDGPAGRDVFYARLKLADRYIQK